MSSEDTPLSDKVVFQGVPGSYRPGENISVKYVLEAELSTHQRDWVGLFRVGWTSNRDYYTFEWAPPHKGEEEDAREVNLKFSGTRLPPDDGHFYQFCYVSRNGMVRGASRPFQFTKDISNKDDLELIEVEDDNILLLQSQHENEKAELAKTVKELTLKSEAVEASILQVKTDFDDVSDKLDQTKKQLHEAQSAIATKENIVAGLNDTIVQYQKENEVLKKDIGLLQVAIADKETEIATVTKRNAAAVTQLNVTMENLQKELVDKSAENVALSEQISRLQAENQVVIHEKKESETQLRVQCSQLEERLRKAEEERESAEGSSEYYQAQYNILERKNEDFTTQLGIVQQEKSKLVQELQELLSEKEALMEAAQLKDQEVNVMRQNLCEVMGTINEPRDELPLLPCDSVGKSAILALQVAYNDLEERYNVEKKTANKLKINVAESQERVKRCGVEYEKLVKQINKMPGSELQREFEEFQLKHDERIAEKNVIIEQQLAKVEEMEELVKQLQITEQEMKHGMETLKAENAQLRMQQQHYMVSPSMRPTPVVPTVAPPTQRPPPSNERECPVCNARFPLRMKQEDFEVHVNTHFQ